jgi:hypothetical protein
MAARLPKSPRSALAREAIMSDKPNADAKVGYKNPSKHTQFKPGQSGNLKGRPKNARGLKTDLRAELSTNSEIGRRDGARHITENGRIQRLS